MTDEYIPYLNSSLLQEDTEETTNLQNLMNNDFALKSGIITQAYEIGDKNNVSNKSVVYDVMVLSQDASGSTSYKTFKKCQVMDSMSGSIADFFETKLRVPEKDPNKQKDPINSNGSTVLLLCLSGDQDTGVIIGFLKHANRKPTLTKSAGMHTEGEFNGIRFSVDKAGALTVTQKTATDNDGKPKLPINAGSQIKMESDGSVELNTAFLSPLLGASNKVGSVLGATVPIPGIKSLYEKIRLDRKLRSISIESRNEVAIQADVSFKANAELNMELSAKAKIILDSEGEVGITTKGRMYFQALTGGFEFQGAKMNLSLFERMDITVPELKIASVQTTIQSPTVIIGPAPLPAVTISTQFMGVGVFGVPVISQAIGPFSSTVSISN